MALPAAELLAISVDEKVRGRGIGVDLIQEGFVECKRRGITRIKVLVSEDNLSANKLYTKCGFELAARIDSHAVISNVYVCEITKFTEIV